MVFLGDINVWMLDRRGHMSDSTALGDWCDMFRKRLFQMFGYICLLNILLSVAYLWICLEMFKVVRVKMHVKIGFCGTMSFRQVRGMGGS